MYLVKRGVCPPPPSCSSPPSTHSGPQILHSFTEKRINRLLNILLRCPGLVMWMTFGHVTYSYGLAAKRWSVGSAVVQQEDMEMHLPALLFMCVTHPVPSMKNCDVLACTYLSRATECTSWTGWWALITGTSRLLLQLKSSSERSGATPALIQIRCPAVRDANDTYFKDSAATRPWQLKECRTKVSSIYNHDLPCRA